MYRLEWLSVDMTLSQRTVECEFPRAVADMRAVFDGCPSMVYGRVYPASTGRRWWRLFRRVRPLAEIRRDIVPDVSPAIDDMYRRLARHHAFVNVLRGRGW